MRALNKYFGGGSKHQPAVMTVLNSMILAVRGGTYDLRLRPATGSTLGQARTVGSAKGGRIEEVGADGTKQYHQPYVQKAQDAKKRLSMEIEVMPAFFTLPFKGKDKDTQIETLLHELSYHAANTKDETIFGKPCYSFKGVKAAMFAGKAANIAENYGYFIASLQNFA